MSELERVLYMVASKKPSKPSAVIGRLRPGRRSPETGAVNATQLAMNAERARQIEPMPYRYRAQ